MTSELQPAFAIAMRGYDRVQVDDYTARLRRELAEAQERAASPNGSAQPPQPAVADFDALGERIAAMLRLAEEEAVDRRRRGAEQAESLVARAQVDAEEIRRSAQADIEGLRARKAEADRESQLLLDHAREQAEDLLGRSRRHAEDQADGIVAQAEADARRILDEARESAQARLDEADAHRAQLEEETRSLEERHRRVLDDLARVRAALDGGPTLAPPPRDEEEVLASREDEPVT